MSALLVVILLAGWTAAALTAALVLGAVIARRERQRPHPSRDAVGARGGPGPRGAEGSGPTGVRREAGCRSAGVRDVRRRRDHRSRPS